MIRSTCIVLATALVALASQRISSAAPAAWPGVPVLMYHKVDATIPAGDAVGRDLTVTPDAFAAQLAYLHDHRIVTLTAEELVAALAAGHRPARAVVLTFDDGYDDAATVALPILRRFGARGTFFVSSGFVGTPRHLSWRQIRLMRAAGMEVTCHGTNHLDLATLDLAGQTAEAGGCVARFAHWIGGAPPRTYAYPAGKYDAITLGLMRRLGMTAAFTERPGVVRDLDHPYELPRRRVRHDDDLTTFAVLVSP